MNFKIILIIPILLFSLNVLGQNIIYKGNKQYSATKTWLFKCENYSWTGDLEVQIAKTFEGGYLRLSIDVPDEMFFIGGPVYVFLADGSMITCSDKGIRDNVDGKSIALYVFIKSEIEKLKILDIQKIRFTVRDISGVNGGPTGNFTAKNKIDVYGLSLNSIYKGPKIEEKDHYETSVEVTKLFE